MDVYFVVVLSSFYSKERLPQHIVHYKDDIEKDQQDKLNYYVFKGHR